MIRTVLVLAVSALVLAVPAVAQTAGPSEQTKRALDRGVIAAEQKEWKLAIKYFLEAYEASVQEQRNVFGMYPPIALNLGLAYSRAGNEIAAIYWFHSYLVVAPDAGDAATVRGEITKLEVAREAKIERLIEETIASARQEKLTKSKGANVSLLAGAAIARASRGELQAALSLAAEGEGEIKRRKEFPRSDAVLADHIYATHAQYAAARGNIAAAAQSVSRIKKPSQAFTSSGTALLSPLDEPIGGNDKRAIDAFWLGTLNTLVPGFRAAIDNKTETLANSCALHDLDHASEVVPMFNEPKWREYTSKWLAALKQPAACAARTLPAWLNLATTTHKFMSDLPEALAASNECFMSLENERVPCVMPIAATLLTDFAIGQDRARRLLERERFFVGIGVTMKNETEAVVLWVEPDGPAARGGIRADDRILAVDGVPVKTRDDAVTRLRGIADTQVAITVQRAGTSSPLTFTMTRTRIRL